MRRSPVEREAMTGDDDDKSGTAHPTKERILQAAAEVFAERGFEGASTREIAAKAQVNISSLHYHWASKDALYIAIVARVPRACCCDGSSTSAVRPGRSPRTRSVRAGACSATGPGTSPTACSPTRT